MKDLIESMSKRAKVNSLISRNANKHKLPERVKLQYQLHVSKLNDQQLKETYNV